MKELNETASLTAFRSKFETSRSFDLEDDMEFCPALLTENDVSCSPGAISASTSARSMSLTHSIRSWSQSPVLRSALH